MLDFGFITSLLQDQTPSGDSTVHLKVISLRTWNLPFWNLLTLNWNSRRVFCGAVKQCNPYITTLTYTKLSTNFQVTLLSKGVETVNWLTHNSSPMETEHITNSEYSLLAMKWMERVLAIAYYAYLFDISSNLGIEDLYVSIYNMFIVKHLNINNLFENFWY